MKSAMMKAKNIPRYAYLLLILYTCIYPSFATNDECSPAGIVRGMCSAPTQPNDMSECEIYMAKSSIPNAGYGVFAGRDFSQKSNLGSIDSPSISITDLYYHNGADPDWAHVNYFWSGDGYTALESEETAELTANIGALANYHTHLVNIDHWAGEYDDKILNRFEDSGAGAISYYRGHQFMSTRDIRAGEELFADYGEEWLTSRGEPFERVARSDDYSKAGKIVATLFHGWKKGKMEGLDCKYLHTFR
jgi:hypothetical protein